MIAYIILNLKSMGRGASHSMSREEAGKWRRVIYAWDFVDAGFLKIFSHFIFMVIAIQAHCKKVGEYRKDQRNRENNR